MLEEKKLLKQLNSAYRNQFDVELDARFLKHVLEKELQKKREAFLQVQLASHELSINELHKLKKVLSESMSSVQGAGLVIPGAKAGHQDILSARKEAPISKKDQSKEADGEDQDNLNLGEATDLNKEELKKLKRRAYARDYYHKKKTEKLGTQVTKAAKRFKTSPEQRAYQRSYYKRKKSSASDLDLKSDDLRADKTSAQRSSIFSGLNDGESKSRESEKISSSKLSFDRLEEDRTVIERAFNPSLGEMTGSLDFPDTELESASYPTKTKLRKSKIQARKSS